MRDSSGYVLFVPNHWSMEQSCFIRGLIMMGIEACFGTRKGVTLRIRMNKEHPMMAMNKGTMKAMVYIQLIKRLRRVSWVLAIVQKDPSLSPSTAIQWVNEGEENRREA